MPTEDRPNLKVKILSFLGITFLTSFSVVYLFESLNLVCIFVKKSFGNRRERD